MNPAAARSLDLFGSDVMIAGALFHTIQSNTGYSGALESDVFWADSVSPRRNIVLPWGCTSILSFIFTFLPAFILTAEVVLVVSYVFLWTSIWFLSWWKKRKKHRFSDMNLMLFSPMLFSNTHLVNGRDSLFANSQNWICCSAVYIFWHICFIELYFTGTKPKIYGSWAFALFEGDRVYSISTIWRFKLYLFSPPLCERL